MEELDPKSKELFDMLMHLPPDLEQVRDVLQLGEFTPDDVNRAALCFLDECRNETLDISSDNPEGQEFNGDYYWEEARLIPNTHSAHLYDIVKLLLDYGLDPDAEVDGTSFLEDLPHIVNEYIGADTLALLLEHGADPMRKNRDGEKVFLNIDFDVVFDAIEQYNRRRFDALVHSWLVFIGYGAKLENGEDPVDLYIPDDRDFHFDITSLREHRNYTFGLSHVKNRGEKWSLHIFDKRTMWEVARL